MIARCGWMVSLCMLAGVCLVSDHCLGQSSEAADSKVAFGPREMLRVMQIDDSLLSQFVDDRPVQGNEEEPLLRLLFRMSSFSQVDLDDWSKPITPADRTTGNIESNRFQFFDLSGRVDEIRKQTVLPELVQRMGFSNYFEIILSQDKDLAVVYSKKLPDAWEKLIDQGHTLDDFIGQSVRVQGMLLKSIFSIDAESESFDLETSPAVTTKAIPVFVAPHIGWYPTLNASPRKSSNPNSTVALATDDLMLLGQMNVDVGRLSQLAHRAGMKGVDRESFYQVLGAVNHSEWSQFAKLSRTKIDIARMIRSPEEVVGELYRIQGVARRAQLIRVNDADIPKRFGLNQYWEIEVFVEMEKPVRFVDEVSGETRVFRDYPFVLCVPSLPPQMEVGEDIRVPVEFSGFFFKLWAYRTEFMSGIKTNDGSTAKQLSPLLIGPTVIPKSAEGAGESQLSLIIACLFTASLAVVWFLLWRASLADKKHASKLFEKNEPNDEAFRHLAD